jgi:iron complex transport system substrate-binding protein
VELILALNPDLVIGAEGFHSRVLNSLKKLGVQTLAIKVNRWDRLEQASRNLEGQIINAGSNDFRLSQLCPPQKSSKASGTKVLILAGVSPKLSPGQQSWSGSLLDRLGLVNSTKELPGSSEFSGYITMSNERLLMIKPEKVLVVNPAGDSAQMVRTLIPFFPGLKVSDFKMMDYYGLINPGSLSSIQKACTALTSL